MRRDPRAADELLAAYVDGVSELSAEERRAVEARLAGDGALRAEADATRELLGHLRELPPAGGEPDWAALERSIAGAVGPEVPRPWWRRAAGRWLVPGAVLAAGAAVVALALRAPAPHAPAPGGDGTGDGGGAAAALVDPTGPAAADPAAAGPGEAPDPDASGETVALWLDGEDVEVEVELDAEELLELPWERDAGPAGGIAGEDLAWLGWIDELDGEALEHAAAALDDPAIAPAPPARKPG